MVLQVLTLNKPWASFQTWTSDKTYDEHTAEADGKYNVQQVKAITDPNSPTYDPTAGLLKVKLLSLTQMVLTLGILTMV